MIVGIYSMSTAREAMNTQAANLAAELFIAKYGNQCTLYALMVYFANYLTEYKGSYAPFDVQDILMQFSKKFLPSWRQRLAGVSEPNDAEDADNEPKGIDALYLMLRNRIREGETEEQLKRGYLYNSGIITDTMIAKAKQDVEDGIF